MYDRACCPSSLFSSHRRCVSCPGAIGGNSSINVGRVVHDEEEQVSNKFHEQDDSSDTTNNAIEILRTDQQVVRDDNILNEEVNNLGSVVQSGDEDGGDATSLPSSPMDADIGMNDNDDNNDDKSNNTVNINNIKKHTSPRLERRRNKHPAPRPPPPPGIDYITVPYGSTEHDNHQHPSIIIDEDISTIYGGVWNSGALLAGGRRLKDMMGVWRKVMLSTRVSAFFWMRMEITISTRPRFRRPPPSSLWKSPICLIVVCRHTCYHRAVL